MEKYFRSLRIPASLDRFIILDLKYAEDYHINQYKYLSCLNMKLLLRYRSGPVHQYGLVQKGTRFDRAVWTVQKKTKTVRSMKLLDRCMPVGIVLCQNHSVGPTQPYVTHLSHPAYPAACSKALMHMNPCMDSQRDASVPESIGPAPEFSGRAGPFPTPMAKTRYT